MKNPRRLPFTVASLAIALLAAGLVTGCGAAPATPAPLSPLKVGLGYIPSVQFAHFYLALQAGYYREAGLNVTFENKIDPDLVVLVGQGAIDVGLADGTSVIPAVSRGIPIRYLATIYAQFPNVVFTKADSGIRRAADLKGKRVGTPGKYGSNWIQLQALLASASLTTDDIEVVLFPDFGQATGLARGAIDAATGYINNDPIQLSEQGIPVTIVTGEGMTDLTGPGIIASTGTIAAKPAALRGFIAATLRAMREIIADPQKGLEAAIRQVPELGSDRQRQQAILEATIATWQSPYTDKHGLGAIDPQAWADSLAFMSSLPENLVPNPVTVEQLIDPSLLPAK
jgi:NitT/TauT family transport system substrate-binding protein